MRKKLRRIIVEFISIFAIIFTSIFLVSNFQTIYNLAYYSFTKSVPQNQSGTFFESKKQYENQIIIPKINVLAPIILAKNRAEILDDLKRGVVYLPRTTSVDGVVRGLPQNNTPEAGNGIILGHSSRLLLDPGKFDIAFLFLSKLEKNDDVFIYLNNKKSAYKVAEKKIIKADDLSNLNFKKLEPTLYLVTCWPPGTNLKRLVVEVKQG